MTIIKRKKPTLGVNDLKSQRPLIAAQLDIERSGVKAEEVTYGSRMKLWWFCETQDHSYPATSNQRIGGSTCCYCSNHKVLPGFNDLATVKKELVDAEWDFEKNIVSPKNIAVSSHTKVWWLCPDFGHSYQQTPNRKGGCAYCWNLKLLVGFNDLATVNPELAAQWHPTLNGELTPKDLVGGSHKIVWWICKRDHAMNVSVKQRSTRGCKNCIHKTSKAERAIAEQLRQAGFKVETSLRTLLDGKEIDIYLPDFKIGIEYNGAWWHSEEQGTSRDSHQLKWSLGKKFGIDIIFIEEIDYERQPELVEKLVQFLKLNQLPNEINTSKPVRNGTIEEVYLLRNGYIATEYLAATPRFFNLNKRVELDATDELPEGKTLATIWGAGFSQMLSLRHFLRSCLPPLTIDFI